MNVHSSSFLKLYYLYMGIPFQSRKDKVVKQKINMDWHDCRKGVTRPNHLKIVKVTVLHSLFQFYC